MKSKNPRQGKYEHPYQKQYSKITGACSYKIFELVILTIQIILSMDIISSIFINTTTLTNEKRNVLF